MPVAIVAPLSATAAASAAAATPLHFNANVATAAPIVRKLVINAWMPLTASTVAIAAPTVEIIGASIRQ